MAVSDRWSRWLLERRDGGLESQRAAALAHLAPIRDRILDAAEPLGRATLLDVGAGDGLVGLAALPRVGPDGVVIFCDPSAALLDRCRSAVGALGMSDRARFVQARAEALAGIPDCSVDVVTTRSVLIFVEDKASAFAAFARVLRPGGRLSVFEPINKLMFPEPADRFFGYDVADVTELAGEVKAAFEGDEASRRAMSGFDDRDLLRLADRAGFEPVHVDCHLDVETGSVISPVSFEAFLGTAPNPNAPTIAEAIDAMLTEPDRTRFLARLNDAFRRDDSKRTMAVAYLAATRAP